MYSHCLLLQYIIHFSIPIVIFSPPHRKRLLYHFTIAYSFELINGRIRKILKVSLDKLCIKKGTEFEDLIDRIVIAPRSEQSPKELQEYFYFCGLNNLANKIIVSECPLR